MAIERYRVLLVEDDEDDFLITRDMLARQERVEFTVDWAESYDAARSAIAEARHDVYLIDYRLGEHTGLELVREAFARRSRAPVMILTGQVDLTIDLEASALGVTDFLVKGELDAAGLERSIRYAISHHQALHDLALSEERYALVVRAANDGIWDWDVQAERMYFSPRWYEVLGLPDRHAEESPNRWLSLVHEDDLVRVKAAIEDHIAGISAALQVEHRIQHADRTWRWVVNRGLAIRDVNGVATRMAGSMSDITEQRAAESQLQHDALHDTLTALPNRALFMDRLEQILQRSTRDPAVGCAVLFLDMDRFKLINDSFSHAVGDQLLIAMARRISDVLRPGDTLARLGGDEFTVLLDGVLSERDATIVAERIQSALSRPLHVAEHDLFSTASIGVALSTPRLTAADLLRNADIAMYDAKHRGRGRYAVFDDSMHRRVVDRMARENELRQVIEQSLLEVYFQPIVDIGSGRIHALEALARWPRQWPEVTPREFIPIAEETGMIGRLGLKVLTDALQSLAHWRRIGLVGDDVRISVNVSARQFDDPHLTRDVLAAIAAAQLPPEALRLEITESTLIEEPERIQRVVTEVCSSGVGLHLDDFGTGYSSLATLHRFPVDALKIDRSFVASIGSSENGSEVIVRSTVALAHSLGLHVIAEGIEEPGQLRALRALGCDYGQGFLFSTPLSIEEVETLLATWSPEQTAALGSEPVSPA